MRILFGSDEKTNLTDAIRQWLKQQGHEIIEIGHLIDENKKWRWVEIGREIGQRVAKGKKDCLTYLSSLTSKGCIFSRDVVLNNHRISESENYPRVFNDPISHGVNWRSF